MTHIFKIVNNPPYTDRGPTANQNGDAVKINTLLNREMQKRFPVQTLGVWSFSETVVCLDDFETT